MGPATWTGWGLKMALPCSRVDGSNNVSLFLSFQMHL